MGNEWRQPGERDRSRIALDEEREVLYWTTRLGVSVQELADAVREVGTSAERVEEYFAVRR